MIAISHSGWVWLYEIKNFEISKHEFFLSIFGNWLQKIWKKKILQAFQPI
jgi:hypothetical protein